MLSRPFYHPWQVVEQDDSFVVTDATGVNLAYIYFYSDQEQQPLLTTSEWLSKDEAQRLAREIARLPALLRVEKGIDPGEASGVAAD